jgi:hypothetical protein
MMPTDAFRSAPPRVPGRAPAARASAPPPPPGRSAFAGRPAGQAALACEDGKPARLSHAAAARAPERR